MNFAIKLLLAVLLTASTCFADGLNMSTSGPTLMEVTSISDNLTPSIFGIKGINGIGPGLCEVKTGKSFGKLFAENAPVDLLTFENCLQVLTETKEAQEKLLNLIPAGSKVNGIYVDFEFVGILKG